MGRQFSTLIVSRNIIIIILNSDEGPIKPSAESLQQLKEKHPPGSGG